MLNLDADEFPEVVNFKGSHYSKTSFYRGNNFRKNEALSKNIIKLWYHELAGYFYPSRSVLEEDFNEGYPDFKNRNNQINDEGTIESNIGSFDYIIVKTNELPCVIISSTFGQSGTEDFAEGDQRLEGYFCRRVHDTITKKNVEAFIHSIGIKDHEMARIERFRLNSQTTSGQIERNKTTSLKSEESKATSNTSREEKLKEAKQLYQKGLISEEQYDLLVKKILGLN